MFTESYAKNNNESLCFFCTQSAHVLCAGVSSQQSFDYRNRSFTKPGGLKNLVDVYNFWSKTSFPQVLQLNAKRGALTPEAKEIRNIFYKGTLVKVQSCLSELVYYGMGDCEKVLELFPSLFAAWEDALPSKESQYAYLKRARVNYSVINNFKDWFDNTEQIYQEISAKIQELIDENNNNKINQFKAEVIAAINLPEILPEKYYLKNKPGILAKKWLPNKDNPNFLLAQDFCQEVQEVIKKWTLNYPAGSWKIDAEGIPLWATTPSSADSPMSQLLLDAKYKFSTSEPATPICFDKLLKFVYYANGKQVKITSPKKGVNTKDNCGSILAKDFIELWEKEVLFCTTDIAKLIVTYMAQISYWTSVRSRLAEMYVLF